MSYVCRMGYLLVLLIGAALLTAMVWKPAPPPQFAGLGSGDIPRSLDGYVSGADDIIPGEVKDALASASLTSRTYQPGVQHRSQINDPLNFVLIGGTDRSALHDPRSCLIGAGMQVEGDHLERLPGTQIEARACHAVGGGGGFDMVYVYLVNGHVINDATQIRAAMLWGALLGRRGTPVYFLRFTRNLRADPRDEAAGHAAMLQFATDMWIRLQPRLMPSTG